jgi:hypothetical protein
MVPNYIAFANREEAEAFVAKQGGEVIDFNIAYDDVSPVGTTAPFRIRTAVTPGKGNFSAGMVYGYSEKNQIKSGSNSIDPTHFIQSNPAQPRAPKEVQVQQQSLTLNWSPTDDLALFMNIPWFERRLTTLTQTQPRVKGKPLRLDIRRNNDNENGLGDITIEGRYNQGAAPLDKFATILLGTTLPTGHFDGNVISVPSAGGTATARAPRLHGGCFIPSDGRISGFIFCTYTVNPEMMTTSLR